MVYAEEIDGAGGPSLISKFDVRTVVEPWGTTVLLVENNAADAFFVERMLRAEGDTFFVHRVCRIQDAMTALRNQDFGVVLLDFSLPDGEDVSLVRALAAVSPLTPVVVLTDSNDPQLALRAVQAGAQDYLYKQTLRSEELFRALIFAVERKRGESQLLYLTHYDRLTGCMSRQRLREHLSSCVRPLCALGILHVGINQLRVIRDAMGPELGDELLVQVAERIRKLIEPADIISRLGGDEFVVLLEGEERVSQAESIAKQLLQNLEQPFVIGDVEQGVTTSIGLARGTSGEDAQGLLLRAKEALERARRAGEDTLVMFLDESTSQGFVTDVVERALDNHELGLYYQPKVDLTSKQILGAEALMRWQHPQKGEVRPAEFLPMLDDTGLTVAVGDWALRRACVEAKRWRRYNPRFHLAVNIALEQCQHAGLVDTVRDALVETGLAPGCLELEFVGEVILQYRTGDDQLFTQLRELGVRIALDDFDSAALPADVADLPIDIVKLDLRRLLKAMAQPDHWEQLSSLVRTVKERGVEVVVKGVENMKEWRLAKELGCDAGQGYWICNPMDARGFAVWMAAQEAEYISCAVSGSVLSPEA
ncbi:MAG: GGDEF domain-containing response regulator [Myxococcales bacterium]|nr:GGDEF domain-containing response regulator [Myxococcales bacterium]